MMPVESSKRPLKTPAKYGNEEEAEEEQLTVAAKKRRNVINAAQRQTRELAADKESVDQVLAIEQAKEQVLIETETHPSSVESLVQFHRDAANSIDEDSRQKCDEIKSLLQAQNTLQLKVDELQNKVLQLETDMEDLKEAFDDRGEQLNNALEENTELSGHCEELTQKILAFEEKESKKSDSNQIQVCGRCNGTVPMLLDAHAALLQVANKFKDAAALYPKIAQNIQLEIIDENGAALTLPSLSLGEGMSISGIAPLEATPKNKRSPRKALAFQNKNAPLSQTTLEFETEAKRLTDNPDEQLKYPRFSASAANNKLITPKCCDDGFVFDKSTYHSVIFPNMYPPKQGSIGARFRNIIAGSLKPGAIIYISLEGETSNNKVKLAPLHAELRAYIGKLLKCNPNKKKTKDLLCKVFTEARQSDIYISDLKPRKNLEKDSEEGQGDEDLEEDHQVDEDLGEDQGDEDQDGQD